MVNVHQSKSEILGALAFVPLLDGSAAGGGIDAAGGPSVGWLPTVPPPPTVVDCVTTGSA
jgi:hypothetical protein